jgi:hypothetical protein
MARRSTGRRTARDLGVPRLKPRRVLLNDASLLLACIREEPLVKRGPDNIRELHAVSL